MDYILREKYLSQLIEVKNTPDIKVITGIRKSGKSVLTEEYAEYLKENDADVNLVIIRLQELDYEELLEYHALNSYILKHYVPGKNNVLIIDEVQLSLTIRTSRIISDSITWICVIISCLNSAMSCRKESYGQKQH